MSVRILLTAVMTFVLFTSPFLSLSSASEAKVIAEVGTVPVTVFDVGREQQRIMPFNLSFHGGVPEETLKKIKKEALETVIERAYKVNYALAQKLKIEKSVIDDRIKELQKKYKSEKEFKTALGEESIKDFRSAIERTFLAQKAEEMAVQKKINISEADVRSYYDTNKQTYKRPRQYKASHILIKVNPSSNAEERTVLENKAKDLLKKAKAGDDFYNLAYYNSDDRSKYVGGDLGYFHEGQTVPEFEEALKKMKVGEVSDLVKSMYGWHIIKLVELNEPKQLEFEEMKVKIREQLEKAAKDKLYSNWMTELKNQYPLKMN